MSEAVKQGCEVQHINFMNMFFCFYVLNNECIGDTSNNKLLEFAIAKKN